MEQDVKYYKTLMKESCRFAWGGQSVSGSWYRQIMCQQHCHWSVI